MITLTILISCSLITIYFAISMALKIKNYEKRISDINNFCVSIKYKEAIAVNFLAIATSLFPIYMFFELKHYAAYTELILAIALAFYIITTIIFTISQQKLIINNNQITYISYFGTKKMFHFRDIKKIDIVLRGKRQTYFLLLIDHRDKSICRISLYKNNSDLFINRLKDAKIIDIDKVAQKTIFDDKTYLLEYNKFTVKSKTSDFIQYYGCFIFMLMMATWMTYQTFNDHTKDAYSYRIISISLLCITSIYSFITLIKLNLHFLTLKFHNNSLKYINIIGQKSNFNMNDISHVKFSPTIDLFYEAFIFLKNGKCICKINKKQKNVYLLIKLFIKEGVEFR